MKKEKIYKTYKKVDDVVPVGRFRKPTNLFVSYGSELKNKKIEETERVTIFEDGILVMVNEKDLEVQYIFENVKYISFNCDGDEYIVTFMQKEILFYTLEEIGGIEDVK